MSDDAKYVDALLANGRLREERDRLREALTSARTMLVAFGGDPRGSASGDEIQAAILDLIDAALAKEVGK